MEAPLKRRGLALLLAAFAALGAVLVNEGAYRLAQQALASLRERDSVRHQTTQLLRSLADAESAQRGFLLTGRDEYLEPLRRAEAEVAGLLPPLSRHYAQGEWRSTVEVLARRTDEKLSELKETVALYRAGSHEAWQALTLTNIGKEKMDAVRVASQSLVAQESARIANDRADIEHALLLGRLGVHGLTALALLWLVLYLRRSAAQQAQQREQARLVSEDRDRLDAEVLRRTAELTELARHLQTVREDERARLARELHDELGALLTAAKLDLARLRKGAAPELTERLKHLGGLIDEGIQLKRRIIEDLRPSALTNLGLEAALDILVGEFAQRSGLQLKAELQPVPLDEEGQLAVYRLVQEALTNVQRHAQARTVHLRLHEREGQVRLRLQDDGRGFEISMQKVGSHGLVGMRHRIEALGGRLTLSSRPGEGTLIEAWLPPSAKP